MWVSVFCELKLYSPGALGFRVGFLKELRQRQLGPSINIESSVESILIKKINKKPYPERHPEILPTHKHTS